MHRIIYKIKVLVLAFVACFSEEDASKWSKRLFGKDIIEEWNMHSVSTKRRLK